MEIKHLFTNELLVIRKRKLSEFYVVKTGRLQVIGDRNEVLAIYGPQMAFGIPEILADKPIEGNVVAFGSTSVVAIEKDVILGDLEDVDPAIQSFIGGLHETLAKRAAK